MTDKNFKRVFFILSAFVLVIVALRAAVVPFCHDETATFYYYIQTGSFLPYHSHGDANNHILNSLLAWICFRLFGDSPFSLRLPNLFALLILIVAVNRLMRRLTHTSSKIILISGLLLSFHWLSFFCLCRGYGISMSLITLAFSYMLDYIEDKNLIHILKIYVLLDLAICANVVLIIMVLAVTALILLFQLYNKLFVKLGNMVMLFIHILIILFWIKYSFFLQHTGLLYAGAGNNYWKITFVSLIYAIVGKENFWIAISIILLYIVLMASGVYYLIRYGKQNPSGNRVFIVFLLILLNGLIIGFYLLKKLFGVNFPEDRTALFFYVLFILYFAFIADTMKPRFSNFMGIITLLAFTVHFWWNLNFRKHSLDMYDVIPERFYDRLLQEQNQSPEKITIGGNASRELFYGFMNYRHNGVLNPLDVTENKNDMATNADYYIALKRDRKFYAPYYSEIDTDKDYGFALLKRKQPLTRNLVFTVNEHDFEVDKKKEFCTFFEIKDTDFKSPNPLLVEFNFKVQSGDMPSLCWLVVGIDSAEGKTMYYRRIPMNWVRYNWLKDDKNTDLILETGPLPSKIHRFVCYMWNVDKQQLKITMNAIKVFQLNGFGADTSYCYKGSQTF